MKKTLVIMAAGMGSRFGGLKQIEPVGPDGEFIIDYSIYDAIKAGFTKVVFLIKEENYEIFKETIGKRVEKHIDVEYAFQDINDIPVAIKAPIKRTKPWGTAHAIYATRNYVDSPFAVINADDFYGSEGLHDASNFLDNMKNNEYATIGYKVESTLTENGKIKRGIIYKNDKELDHIIESEIYKNKEGKIIAAPLNDNNTTPFEISPNTTVSMNLLCFDLSIYSYLENFLIEFFKNDNLENAEAFIPDVLTNAMREGYAKVSTPDTESVWYGITYHEDLENIKKAINKLIDEGKYPKKLWENV